MKWNSHSIDDFVSARDFVDTALVPLMPLDLHHDPSTAALQGEYTALLAEEVEKQLTGRILLVPPYPYKKNAENSESVIRELNDWNTYYYSVGITNVVCLTCDEKMAEMNAISDVRVIWMPLIPLNQFEARQAKGMIRDQAAQVLPKIMKLWQYSDQKE